MKPSRPTKFPVLRHDEVSPVPPMEWMEFAVSPEIYERLEEKAKLKGQTIWATFLSLIEPEINRIYAKEIGNESSPGQ